jgi:CPA2 family monovalent cation:H+ antiporter-2
MTSDATRPAGSEATPASPGVRHVIIIGFGLSGRSVVNNVIERGESYAVIEANPAVVERCALTGLNIINGDARQPEILREAGIDRAAVVAVTVPNDAAALDVVEIARGLNPTVRIIARCTFVSGGMEAARRGADDTVIAEQVVATEFGRAILTALDR